MKKILVLASLGSLVLFYACGDSAPGEKAANAQTAAAMFSATSATIQPYLIDSINIDSTENLDVCIDLTGTPGTATLTTTETSSTSGTKTFKFTNCITHICDTDFVSLSGTIENTYNNTATTASMTLNGTITYGAAVEGFEDRWHLAGTSCTVELTLTDAPIDSEDTEDYLSGYVCGYDWTEVDVVTEEEYCAAI